MKTSYFSINEEGVSIRSKFYGTDARTYKRIVIFSHGFGGHKDNKSAEKFAEKIFSKYKDIAVISFDWPCHGEDAIKQLALSDCDKYLGLVIEYAKKTYSAEELENASGTYSNSDFVRQTVGIGNVCERAAVLALTEQFSGELPEEAEGFDDRSLILRKKADDGVTAAVAAVPQGNGGRRKLRF